MKNKILLNNIIENIKKNENPNNTIIVPYDISDIYIKKILDRKDIKNTYITKIDDYVFKLNNIKKNNLHTSDVSFLENAILDSKSFFEKYNLTNEIENILSILNKLILERSDVLYSSNFSIDSFFSNEKIFLQSNESKIFYEILKIWLIKSKDFETYIGTYLKILNLKINTPNNMHHHILCFDEYEDIEKKWMSTSLENINTYNRASNRDIYDHNFTPRNLNKYKSFDFDTQEDELEYISEDIKKTLANNENAFIALINNDRYFARRLRAILDRDKIKYNDFSGWLLSTSSSCCYIDNIFKYFVVNDNYINLQSIVSSPFFYSEISSIEKEQFLNNVLRGHKNNIEVSVSNFIKNIKDNRFKFFFNIERTKEDCSFISFKKFLLKKIEICKSYEIINEDEAGKEFILTLNYLEKINKTKNIKLKLEEWYKILTNYLETRTFRNLEDSKIDYTDIKHASLYYYDKIYVNSMSIKNFPKKIINNFNKKNAIYNELSINSSLEQNEYIEDFISLSDNTELLLISYHASNGKEVFTKSKFKIYLDHFLDAYLNPALTQSEIIKEENECVNFYFDKKFLNISYRDIENFNFCLYCFYLKKNSPNSDFSSIEENPMLFGSFVHFVLDNFIKEININSRKEDLIKNLNLKSTSALKKFFSDELYPYEVELWYKILPKIIDFFYNDLFSKHKFISEKTISKKLSNGITIKGRCDLQYSIKEQKHIVDYKTGSYLPTKSSVISGDSLQLPFYTVLEPDVNIVEYLTINVSKNTLDCVSFSYDQLSDARKIIYDTTEKISNYINNRTIFTAEKTSCGCEICGFEITKNI